MGIQSQLDNAALAYLPRIKEIIINAPDFESNQMKCKAISMMCNSCKPIVEMDSGEIESFENELMSAFKYRGWL